MKITSSNPCIYKSSTLMDKVQSYREAINLFLLYSIAKSIYGATNLKLFPFILIMETKMEKAKIRKIKKPRAARKVSDRFGVLFMTRR